MRSKTMNTNCLFIYPILTWRQHIISMSILLFALQYVHAQDKPNIILIMSDDMGFSDLGCYGGEINTPHLDQLAGNGLRFTQFYNTGRCCPTRASLMTGLYPHQAGIGRMLDNYNLPGYTGNLGGDAVTIAEVLRPAGYNTYMVGKWHLVSKEHGQDKEDWPLQRGFEHFYGTIDGAGNYWDPAKLTRDNEFISPYADPMYQPKETYYYTDALSDNAVKYIKEHNPDKPFFMYLAYTAAHWPMHARERDIAKYSGKYDNGYAPIREKRHQRMRELGLINDDCKLSVQEGNWDKQEDKEWEARCMEVYAAMVDNMDQGIGRILQTLKNSGQLDNTLILFLQDNGGCAENYGRDTHLPRVEPGNPLSPMRSEDIQQDMLPRVTRNGYPVKQGHVMPGPANSGIGYGKNWANVSNTPFREYKHYVHEGGISTPLIVHWPKGFKAKNELRHTPAHLIDIMATCVDVSGAHYPNTFVNSPIQPMEGKSLLSVFTNDEMENRHILFEHENNAALRKGDWKLVGKRVVLENSTITDKWELYDMAKDRSEMNDLSTKYPEKRDEMIRIFEKEAKRTRIFPADVKR